MTISAELAKARKHLKATQMATSRFTAELKGRPVSPEDEGKYHRLLTAEMKAVIRVTDLEMGPNRSSLKPKT